MRAKLTRRTMAKPAPVPLYAGDDIRALRAKYNLSQASLAWLLNTSVSAVQQWEQNNRHPRGPINKLLSLLDKHGIDFFL